MWPFRRKSPEEKWAQRAADMEKSPDAPEDPGRRKFLKKSAEVGVGVAAAGGILGAASKLIREGSGGEAHGASLDQAKNATATPETQEEAIDYAAVFAKELADFSNQPEVKEILSTPDYKRTVEQEDTLHAMFIDRFPYEHMEPVLKQHFTYRDPVMLYKLLYDYRAHGYVQQYAQDKKNDIDSNNDFFESTKKYSAFYAIRTTDYFPADVDIRDQDIDPRNWAVNYTSLNDTQDEQVFGKKTEKEIIEHPGWTSKERIAQFHECFSDPIVRHVLQHQENMTLVEAFSFVKVLVLREEERPGVARGNIIQELLDERHSFETQEILGQNTEDVVFIYDADLIKSTKVSPDEVKQAVADMTKGRASFTSYEAGQDSITSPDELIANTKGKTLLYSFTHGSPTDLYVDNGEVANTLNYTDFADGLIKRMRNIGDPQTLGEVTIVVEACNSYLYTKDLIQALQNLYEGFAMEEETGLSFKDISLPTIITTVHEGALGRTDASFLPFIVKHDKKKPFTGAEIQRKIQPHLYTKACDVTIRRGGRGEVIEIGKLQQEIDKMPA